MQGQGFENIGEETFIYYGAWDPRHWTETPERGGVGIAVLPRDRFGDLVVETFGKGPGDYQLPEITSEFVTSVIEIKNAPRFYLNADGLGPDAALKIEALDDKERPLSGCTATVHQSGFQAPILWKDTAVKLPKHIHLRVTFKGKRNTDIRFSAIYLQ